MFENGNPQTLSALSSLLQGGGPQGYAPEDRVNQFFHAFGVQNIDPVARAKAMQLLQRQGVNMPMGLYSRQTTGQITPTGDVGNDIGGFYGQLMQQYPASPGQI
jgi:hypothetical protein